VTKRGALAAVATAVLAVSTTGAALAHGAERGFVLLMPSGFAMAGGAAAVAASFVAVALLPDAAVRALMQRRLVIGPWPPVPTTATSTASFLILVALLAAGATGIRDPLENPLPLAVWTFGWVLLPLLHVVFGHLWAGLNPFVGPYRLLDRALGHRLSAAARPPPERLGYAPAIAFFLLFAWIELVFPAPEDPPTLARLVFAWLAVTFVQMIVFGERWLEKGEALSVVYRFLADLAPIQPVEDRDGRRRLTLVFPGAGLARRPPLPPSGVVFLLLMLATVSFDGFSKTFAYLGVLGVNPLEYPGRTAMMGANTVGLVLSVAGLALVFLAAVAIGTALAGPPARMWPVAGRIVTSILPISIAFHFAHYLSALLINGQFALAAFGDPFGLGWRPFGFGSREVAAGFMATASGAATIWTLQTLAVTVAHVIAVVLAHGLLVADGRGVGRLLRLEAPLAVAMVAYTVFGLWLLSTPIVG
jgi:hypothetical protein